MLTNQRWRVLVYAQSSAYAYVIECLMVVELEVRCSNGLAALHLSCVLYTM